MSEVSDISEQQDTKNRMLAQLYESVVCVSRDSAISNNLTEGCETLYCKRSDKYSGAYPSKHLHVSNHILK